MKKVFKKSILIVTSFIIGSVACISIGVYAYSYSATDIEYTSGKSVKQAVDDLYAKEAARKTIVEIATQNINTTYGGDACFQANEGCACYYIYNYVNGDYNASLPPIYTPPATPSTVGQKFNYGTHTGCSFVNSGCYVENNIKNGGPGTARKTSCGVNLSSRMSNFWSNDYNSNGAETARCYGTLECDT